MAKIDSLPQAARFDLLKITMTGDVLTEKKERATEELELWMRNPVHLMQEIMANPAFRDVLALEPCKLYQDSSMQVRILAGAETADWWSDIQVKLDIFAAVLS